MDAFLNENVLRNLELQWLVQGSKMCQWLAFVELFGET